MDEDTLAEFEKLLNARLAELVEDEAASRDSAGVVELDQTRMGRLSRMDALQQQAMAKASQGRKQLEIRRVRAALGRIRSGDYGYCLECDEDIPLPRLKFNPAAPLCVRCADRT